MKTRNKYPSWLIRRKLNHIRNRYAHYLQSHHKHPMNNYYTWADCYHKAKGKLYYRFNNWLMGSEENDDWMAIIAFIKARLVQHFDEDQAWRVAEYNILEKVSKQDFHRIKSPNLIWHYIAVDKAGRANKLIKRIPHIRQRTDKYDWEDVICNSKIRMDNRDPETTSDVEPLWMLCLKANIEKIRSRVRWLDWNSAIQRNYNKLRRLFS